MNVNATFFVQLIHFFIGYLILERLFIRPWINSITQDLNQRKKFTSLLKQAQERVALKEKFKEEQWREFQVSFAQTIPNIALETQEVVTSPEILQKTTSQQAITILDAQKIVHSLVTRLSHE